MKKLMIFGLLISLFAFWGSKNEVNDVQAEEVAQETGTSATFFERGSRKDCMAIDGDELEFYSGRIVSIKISNKVSDVAKAKEDKICNPIKIKGCIFTDASGNSSIPEEGVIFAYLSYAPESIPSYDRYDCVFYADVDTIYANSDSTELFSNFRSLKRLDISMLNMSKITNMTRMFSSCKSLTSLTEVFNSSNFNTSKVTNMKSMFSGCSSLTTLDLSNFNTSNVTNMATMFNECSSLTSLNLSNFDTSKVTSMSGMFADCISLTELNLSGFDTSNVTSIFRLFQNCSSLTELDLSMFNTSNVKTVGLTFDGCTSLKKLDISSFDLTHSCERKVNEYVILTDLVSNCTSLEYLKTPILLPTDSTTNSEHSITLPTQFTNYYGVTTLTSDNLAQYKELCIPGDEFIKNWKALRAEGGDNGLCAALITGTEGNTKLTQLLTEYDAFDTDYQEYVNKAIDENKVTIGDSISYIKNYLNLKQSSLDNSDATKEDAGSFVTMSITEESPYLIAVITSLGILAVLGYYFYNKKKQAM